jgi:aminocarboxymuconate-semialdehyde decarboxylase
VAVPCIDLHTHILPETWPDLKARYGYGGWVRLERGEGCGARMMVDDRQFREVQENCWDPEARRADCDRCAVDVQVLSTVPVMFAYWAQPEHTLDLARLLNDHIAGVCRRYPDRFVGLGTLPMQAPELAVEELERCVGPLGLAGVEIGTHVNDWNLDEPALFPIFERAARLGAAVFVHPWDMLGRDRMTRYWLPWLVGMPAETSLAICSMVLGGVLERLPDLRVAFAHGGGAFPFTLGRIAHGHRVRPDLCAVRTERDPTEFIGRFWVDSLVHDERALRYLLDVIGTDRVCLGSDYPFPLGEACPGALVRNTPLLDEREKARVLGENAIEFLGVDAPAPTRGAEQGLRRGTS